MHIIIKAPSEVNRGIHGHFLFCEVNIPERGLAVLLFPTYQDKKFETEWLTVKVYDRFSLEKGSDLEQNLKKFLANCTLKDNKPRNLKQYKFFGAYVWQPGKHAFWENLLESNKNNHEKLSSMWDTFFRPYAGPCGVPHVMEDYDSQALATKYWIYLSQATLQREKNVNRNTD